MRGQAIAMSNALLSCSTYVVGNFWALHNYEKTRKGLLQFLSDAEQDLFRKGGFPHYVNGDEFQEMPGFGWKTPPGDEYDEYDDEFVSEDGEPAVLRDQAFLFLTVIDGFEWEPTLDELGFKKSDPVWNSKNKTIVRLYYIEVPRLMEQAGKEGVNFLHSSGDVSVMDE